MRIRFDQSVSSIFSADFGGGIARRRKHWDAPLGVMRVGGENMNRIVLEKPVRGAAHALAPEPGERRSR